MRKGALICSILLLVTASSMAEVWKAASPDGNIALTVEAGRGITYSVAVKGKEVISPTEIGMAFDKGAIAGDVRVDSATTEEVSAEIRPAVPEKRAVIPDIYTALTLHVDGGHQLSFRVYDDAVAWRFATAFEGPVKVLSETAAFSLAGDYTLVRTSTKRLESSFESPYTHELVSEFEAGALSFAPLLVDAGDVTLVITEADLDSYPGMFLSRSEESARTLEGIFPRYPKRENAVGDRHVRVLLREDWLAQTEGKRTYPWRVIAIAEDQGDLIANDVVYRLGPDLALSDTSWIQPGKVAWDWWNAWNISGVDFKSGCNIETWKYYVDFAARHGIEYIILDEGWSDTRDLFSRKIDLEDLANYGKEKGVKLILWCVWCTLDQQLDKALADFERLGIAGVKVDFMDRDDQKMVEFYHKLAAATAKHHLLLDFHGAYKPTGLRRAYPNLITREGVFGMENSKWSDKSDPEYCVSIPFIRMLAGPMDYTPGAMNNAQKNNFRPISNRPMSLGTRCQQLAMYVVFESPLQMLSDTPDAYEANQDCLEFIAATPTTWDDTVALGGSVGEYVAVARRKGKEWFIGVMTDWSPRELTLDLSFLPKGTWEADCFADGVNADRIGTDYKRTKQPLTSDSQLKVVLAPGGGWVARLTQAK